MDALAVIGTISGNTLTFLDFFKKNSTLNTSVTREFDVSPLSYSHIILGSYTWGNGKIPKKMKEYLIANHHLLEGKKVFIFGSGNSVYPRFCGAVDGMAIICKDSGAEVHGCYKFDQSFNEEDLSPEERENLISMIKQWSA